ncbi:hypothetical protein VTL71DRAFT_368 [Oculimacula yallundae]|uniref:Glycan binding protein Y3-like domain-containing protein n=1 Tax=Oculimacula yallundae TaxID=86028 RepID=A0ABR4CZY9_9HELO
MQFTSTLLALATFATVVSAGCYTSGEGFDTDNNRGHARRAAIDLCQGQVLSGYFNQGQSKTRCADMDNNKKVDFQVVWLGKGGLTLKPSDCEWRLHNEINGCNLGGESIIADWFFRSDPNNGRC